MTPLNIPGIANGYKVDDIVWRGAQPPYGPAAWEALYDAGCRTVIDLDTEGDQNIRSQAAYPNGLGMAFYALQWNGILAPDQQKIEAALAIIDQHTGAPVFIHCKHGSDRTGTLCACWRLHHDGWKFEDAMEEAFTSLGLQGMHEFWMAAAVAQYAHDQGKR